MTNVEIKEMYFLAFSSRQCLDKRYNHSLDEYVNDRCTKFCKKHKINITHGSAYKELWHKFNYYKIRNIKSIIDKRYRFI